MHFISPADVCQLKHYIGHKLQNSSQFTFGKLRLKRFVSKIAEYKSLMMSLSNYVNVFCFGLLRKIFFWAADYSL